MLLPMRTIISQSCRCFVFAILLTSICASAISLARPPLIPQSFSEFVSILERLDQKNDQHEVLHFLEQLVAVGSADKQYANQLFKWSEQFGPVTEVFEEMFRTEIKGHTPMPYNLLLFLYRPLSRIYYEYGTMDRFVLTFYNWDHQLVSSEFIKNLSQLHLSQEIHFNILARLSWNYFEYDRNSQSLIIQALNKILYSDSKSYQKLVTLLLDAVDKNRFLKMGPFEGAEDLGLVRGVISPLISQISRIHADSAAQFFLAMTAIFFHP